MVFLLGKFLARSIIATSVPIDGPSTDISAKMPAAWLIMDIRGSCLEAMIAFFDNGLPRQEQKIVVWCSRKPKSTQFKKIVPLGVE